MKNLFSTRTGVILTGAAIGVLAPLLQKLGNPGNMGICVACFARDIAGAFGLHRASAVQYLRPEIPGFVLGAFLAALAFREYRPRSGSAPLVRFVLGVFAVIGALVFLGCPWRAFLRLAGGDWNALFGLAGLVFGIWLGTLFFRMGYSLGRAHATHRAAGWIFPAIALALVLARLLFPPAAAGEGQSGLPLYSVTGPGSMHAPVLASLGVGLLIGFLAQRSRFCTMGAFRDLILFRQPHLFQGVAALVVAAAAANVVFGQFRPGFVGQPAAHTSQVWNFAGMALAGLAFALAGGCPGRQFFLSGEGDGDAAIFTLGMLVGAALAHNFGLAGTSEGVGVNGMIAVGLGLTVCAAIGLTMRGEETE